MERILTLEGCLNFRDLGGYPTVDGAHVAWRRLFRSDALHGLSTGDVAVLVDDHGLTDVVDLRSTAEVEAEGRGLLRESPVNFHHTPLYDGAPSEGRAQAADMTLAERYFGLLEVAREPVAQVIRQLAGSQGAAVYHCAAGKDRTGVISAVLLSLFGVRDEVIVADYALTQQNLDAILERLNAMDGYKNMLAELPPDTQHANPETMMGLLERVADGYGDMRGYVRAAGIDDATIDALRAHYVVAA